MDGSSLSQENAKAVKSSALFDMSSISKTQADTLCAAVMAGIPKLFSQPGEEERFQAWLKMKGLIETPVEHPRKGK